MIPALCCRCGTARQVSRGSITISTNRTLKCTTCGQRTMHALVVPDPRDSPGDWRAQHDWREEANVERRNLDGIYDEAGTQPPISA